MRKKFLKLLLLIILLFLPRLGGTNAWYSDTEKTTGNVLSTGCWTVPEIPVLVYPANNTYAGAGSVWDLNPYLDWEESSSTCPLDPVITYQYQTSPDADFSGTAYTSDWLVDSRISMPGIPDGTYYWRVRGKDSFGNTSDFSSVWTISTVPPEIPTMSLRVENKLITEADKSTWLEPGGVLELASDTIDGLTITPPGGATMYRLGRPTYSGDDGRYVWENRLLQTFPAGAKTLALDYNFFTKDSGPYDDPGFLIRLNGQDIFATGSASINPDGDEFIHYSNWQRFYYDLGAYDDSDLLNLAIYGGNTGDRAKQSWAYVANITTNIVMASESAQYRVTGNTAGGPATCGYTLIGEVLTYQCVGVEGGVNSKTVTAIVDNATPSAVIDLSVDSVSSNSVILVWHSPGEASNYDVRFADFPITASNFDAAEKVIKVSAPKDFDAIEVLEVLGLNPETPYWFALKSSDAAANVSPISNVIFETTLGGSLINQGDIIINELMWMGTGASTADEYLELRNMTERTLNLDGLELSGMAIDFSGKTIAPHGYFLITNYAPGSGSSHLKSSVAADIVSASLELSTTTLGIELLDSLGNIIDRAGDGGIPKAGVQEAGKYYSMERMSVPGDGASPFSWYSCIDTASSGEFFTTTDERGTPRTQNRSVNEPVKTNIVPQLSLSVSSDQKNLEISLENISGYTNLDYQIIYDTDTVSQGITGKMDFSETRQLQKSFQLGTCSTGGTCVYHLGVKNIKAKVTLFSPELILEKTL